METDITSEKSPTSARLIAIGAGKGGVGVSMVATNLAVFLAQIGKNVCLIDGNLEDAGLYAWLGMDRAEPTIGDVLAGRIGSMEAALRPTQIAGLSLLAGTSELLGNARVSKAARDDLLTEIRNQRADFIIVDSLPGLHPLSVDLFGHCDVPIAVTVATPDAVEATYRFFEASYLSKLISNPNADEETRKKLVELGTRSGRPPTAREIVTRIAELDSGYFEEAKGLAATFHPQLVVNKIRVKADEGLGEAMVAATSRWIGIVAKLLGPIDWDDNVWLSLRRGIPILVDFPQSRACRGLERIVRRLLGQDRFELFAPAYIPPPVEKQTLYEILEIYPGASEEEVRRGFKQVREYFGVSGLAVRGACLEEEREDYQLRAQEAHETLIDKSRRGEYDKRTFPQGFPNPNPRFPDGRREISGRVISPHDSLPKVELRDDQMVTGAFLGEIRKSRGIDLEDISNRAKISISYLKAIEEERFGDLPEPVYVRGFVTEYARYLKIQPIRAVRDFMATYDAAKRSRGK